MVNICEHTNGSTKERNHPILTSKLLHQEPHPREIAKAHEHSKAAEANHERTTWHTRGACLGLPGCSCKLICAAHPVRQWPNQESKHLFVVVVGAIVTCWVIVKRYKVSELKRVTLLVNFFAPGRHAAWYIHDMSQCMRLRVGQQLQDTLRSSLQSGLRLENL